GDHHVHRRSAQPGPVPGGPHQLRVPNLQQRGADPAGVRLGTSTRESGRDVAAGTASIQEARTTTVEREAVLVGIDVGTSKVCTLIGEVSRDGRMTVMGHGTVPSSGLQKSVVVNIDQTVRSIAESVERAERLSGWKIDRAFVAVGGQHVE